MLLTRFYLYPYTFRASFTHPTESLFVPAVAVSFGTILINIVEYGFGRTGLWLNRAVLVLFWFDAALAVFLSVLIYMILYALNDHIYTSTNTTPDGQLKPSQSHA
jgi:tellurite resistance protein TehA-like permease